jgi:hypothetical protein
MQGRSWMAALTLAAGLFTVPPAARAEDKPSVEAKPNDAPSAEPSSKNHTVKLEIRIAGLGAKGCDVEIKPGHAGCKFKTLLQHVDSRGYATVVVKDVQTQSADRDCTFAITIREAGQAELTVRRGLRLGTGNETGKLLSCFLNSPSRLARVIDADKTKR